MKITIERSTLVERLQHVTKANTSKTALPILEGVLIESNAELTLTCSDSHFTIMTKLDDYQEHEAGVTVVPAKKLLEIIRKMPEKPISIEVDGGTAVLKCGSTKVELPALDPEEFPRMSFPKESTGIIDGDNFSHLVDSTKYAVSTNEQTPVLQGVNIQLGDGQITAIATDRHRLAKQSIDFGSDAEGHGQYVAPVKALEAVVQLKPKNVEVAFSGNSICLRAGAFQYIATLHDGTYPDTSRIIPKSTEITVLVNTKKLLQTLELAEKIVEEKTKIVRLDVTDGEMFVSAKDGPSGVEESIEAEVTGGELKLSLNAKYLIDALKCITTERAEIWLTGSMSPVIVQNEGDRSGMHLVLPYRTSGG
jgi:DNA polymerase III subunit beta